MHPIKKVIAIVQLTSCFTGIFAVISVSVSSSFKEDIFNIYKNTAIQTRDILDRKVTPDQIKYNLVTRHNPKIKTPFDRNGLMYNNYLLGKLRYKQAKIVFLIHGWIDCLDFDQPFNVLTKAFFDQEEEYYVVQVDWSLVANQFYYVASINTADVANYISEIIIDLHDKHLIDLSRFILVGHSLGAQVAGFIGKTVQKKLNKKLPRIIGLEPAGPLFDIRPESEKLNPDDAEFVLVIHTNGGTFGHFSSCGTVDIFVNGGSFQPGCIKIDILDPVGTLIDPLICHHLRAYDVFAEALKEPELFIATKCSSFIVYSLSQCSSNPQLSIGDMNLNDTTTGNYYVSTNSQSPFGIPHKRGRKWKDYIPIVGK